MELTREIFDLPKPHANVVAATIKTRSHFLGKGRCLICINTYDVDIALVLIGRLLLERMVLPTEGLVVSQRVVWNICCLEAAND